MVTIKLSLGTSLDFLPRFRILSGPTTAENRSANLELGQLFESTVKRITEVTYSKDIITEYVIVINIYNVVNTAHFENFLQR